MKSLQSLTNLENSAIQLKVKFLHFVHLLAKIKGRLPENHIIKELQQHFWNIMTFQCCCFQCTKDVSGQTRHVFVSCPFWDFYQCSTFVVINEKKPPRRTKGEEEAGPTVSLFIWKNRFLSAFIWQLDQLFHLGPARQVRHFLEFLASHFHFKCANSKCA